MDEYYNLDAYIEEFVTLNGEMLLSVLDSNWNGEKVRDLAQVSCLENEMVLC